MLEVYVLVEKKKSLCMKIMALLFFLAGSFFLYAALVDLFIFFAVTILFWGIGWYLYRSPMEFEYSYFDGDFRFAKIYNREKRKELKEYNIENVVVVAPQGDRSVYQYENDSQVKSRDLTSGYNDRTVYCLVAKTEAGFELTKFEPDEKYLDAVCIKYRQKVVR